MQFSFFLWINVILLLCRCSEWQMW
jgi:hypothetical protein